MDSQAVTILSAHPTVTANNQASTEVKRCEKGAQQAAHVVTIEQPEIFQFLTQNLRGSDVGSGT